MSESEMILVVGATGMVGSEICRLLSDKGKSVRALVRETSNPQIVARLEAFGAEIVRGDLKNRASLDAACQGATAVVSTASATRTPQPGDSLESVDAQGQMNIIEAAKTAGVDHFVFISFPPTGLEFPLQSAKRTAEERLKTSGMTYTVLQPTCFMEVWLSPHLGFDMANAQARIYGLERIRSVGFRFRMSRNSPWSHSIPPVQKTRLSNWAVRMPCLRFK